MSALDLASNLRLLWHALRLDDAGLAALDTQDAASWLRRMGVSPRFVEWFWFTSCLALLNVPLSRCSAASLMRVVRLMLARSSYHFGFPRSALAALYEPGCRRAIEAAGGRVPTGAALASVQLRDGAFDRFVLADGAVLRARAAVLALPPREFAQVAPRPWPAPDAAARLEPCRYVCSYLWFDRKLGAERFWARVWRPGQLNVDFYDLANIRGPAGAPSLIACNAIDVDAGDVDDATIVRRTHAEIAAAVPGAAQATLRHAVVHRVPMAIARPHPGSEARRPPTATPFDGLLLAGDWTATGLPSSMTERRTLGRAGRRGRGGALRPHAARRRAAAGGAGTAVRPRPVALAGGAAAVNES